MATIDQAAAHIDLSARHFKTLADAGVFKRAASGRHDLDDVRVRYIRHLRTTKAGIEGGGKSSLSEARARSANAIADRNEMETANAKGELCRIGDAFDFVIATLMTIREHLLVLPGKMANGLHKVDGDFAFHVLRDEIYECLDRIANPTDAVRLAVEICERSGGNPKLLEMLVELHRFHKVWEETDETFTEVAHRQEVARKKQEAARDQS